MSSHWQDWHQGYDDPDSSLSRRLAAVQGLLRSALDRAPRGRVALLSLCSGDGRDILGVLGAHPRRHDVDALLVDSDDGLAHVARRAALDASLTGVHCVVGDAGHSGSFASAAPFDVVVACGIFGNVTFVDIDRTVRALPSLLAPSGSVIWTRHRRAPDLTVAIRDLFASAGFREEQFVEVSNSLASVGWHTLAVAPHDPGPPRRLFEFVGNGVDALT